MEGLEFKVHEDFDFPLFDKFNSFCDRLTEPNLIFLDIESQGGFTQVLEQMELKISGLKKRGFVFVTNVENYAYSCGLFLFLLGDVKECSENARFLFHSSGYQIENERLILQDVLEMAEELKKDEAFCERILKENTDINDGMYDILKKNNNFLSRSDMVFLGLMKNEYEY